MKLWCESAWSTSTNTDGVVWVRNGLKLEDKASGRQAPWGKNKPQSKLYHHAVNFEILRHPGPYHLFWRHVVRNNSPRIDHLWRRSCDGQHSRPSKSYGPSELPQVYEARVPVHPAGTAHVGPQWIKTKVTNLEEPACYEHNQVQFMAQQPVVNICLYLKCSQRNTYTHTHAYVN